MAEFQEVMKNYERMCKEHLCTSTCPMYKIGVCEKIGRCVTEYGIEKVEQIVMKWAEEHPEPVYPTWARWLESMGLIEIRWNGPVLASMRIGVDDTDYIPIVKKLLENIPADMAQKIGIPPVEVHK